MSRGFGDLKWSKEDDQILLDEVAKKTQYWRIAGMLNHPRTIMAVQSRISRLNTGRAVTSAGQWSPEDDALFVKLYAQGKRLEVISDELSRPRSPAAMRVHIRRLIEPGFREIERDRKRENSIRAKARREERRGQIEREFPTLPDLPTWPESATFHHMNLRFKSVLPVRIERHVEALGGSSLGCDDINAASSAGSYK